MDKAACKPVSTRKKHGCHIFGVSVYFECVKCRKREDVITLCRRKTIRTVCDACQRKKQNERYVKKR